MIELKNLCFSVLEDGETKEIIKDMNLTIGDDRFVVITGPNGSGKSTLAKLIAGIEKPTSGQILFNGQDITEASVTERAKLGISYAFQQPVRFKGIQVKDLLKIAAGKFLGREQMYEYLSLCGLCAKDYIDREVNASLSGGELKRIEIATLLARNTASPTRSGSCRSLTTSWSLTPERLPCTGRRKRCCRCCWAPVRKKAAIIFAREVRNADR